MSKGWDNATLKKLKALTGKGLSTAEIGKQLGISKNAVVGKLNRLGWNSKAGGVAAAGATKIASKGKAAAKVAKVAPGKKATPVKASVKKVVPTKLDANKDKKTPVKAKKTVTVAPKTASKKTATPKEKVAAPKESRASVTKNLAMHQRIIQHSLEMANLKPNQCRWPIGDPDSEHFHFCGETVFVGKPYCYEHCKQAYQFTPPKKK